MVSFGLLTPQNAFTPWFVTTCKHVSGVSRLLLKSGKNARKSCSGQFTKDFATIVGDELQFFCDKMRHLVCLPYTIENLHVMADQLNIKRCWFHSGSRYPHYDIPKRRIAEITTKCKLISPRELLSLCQKNLSTTS